MGHKKPNILTNLWVVGLILGLILSLYLITQFSRSLVFRETDRINIGVYGERPYVYSLNPHKNLAFVVEFEPEYEVNVPGGYGWYKLSSLNLLGRIEKNRPLLLEKAFSELIGSPVDYVYFPKEAAIKSSKTGSFANYYRERERIIFGNSYQNSINNLFDRIFIRRIFRVRPERLIFLATSDLFLENKGNRRYDIEVLDGRLKGLFYHDSILKEGLKAVLVTRARNYESAKRILRQVEGMGIKVIEIRVAKKVNTKTCLATVPKLSTPVLSKLKRYFDCRVMPSTGRIVKLEIGDSLAEKFRYN